VDHLATFSERELEMILEGRAWKFGANVDTDAIIPARYLNTSDERELASHVMEGIYPGFAKKVEKGDVIVAGDNFGSGSSREHAPLAIKSAGISCVIASSFARIFYRNAINIGLTIMECPGAVAEIVTGDRLRIDLGKGTIENLRSGRVFQAIPYPDFMREIIAKGGLVEYVRSRLNTEGDRAHGEQH
jgi:3-isopropylmalate/(R)-2-methylmalate dehydratase small subunit